MPENVDIISAFSDVSLGKSYLEKREGIFMFAIYIQFCGNIL